MALRSELAASPVARRHGAPAQAQALIAVRIQVLSADGAGRIAFGRADPGDAIAALDAATPAVPA